VDAEPRGALVIVKLLTATLALASCAPTWTNAQAPTEIAAIGALACDGGQTSQWSAHARQAGLEERNPILGSSPSTDALWTYLAAISFGVIMANKTLPAWAAVAVNSAVLSIEAHAIGTNAYYGASIACGLGTWDEQTAEFRVHEAQQQP
jgi:hypothetical protein